MASEYLLIAAASLIGLCVVAATLLKGWQGWLQLKSRELETRRPEIEGGAGNGMARIEIADLKERLRKLEAIAAGVDL
jgi:hypothetical protein